MKRSAIALAAVAAALTISSTPVLAAAVVPTGTMNFSGTASPTVTLTGSPNMYSATNLGTVDYSGTGGFAPTGTGTLNGSLSFSSVVGSTTVQTPAVSDFFSFSDGSGGSYDFSVDSVTTQNYSFTPASTAVALYLLGSTTDASKGVAATPTSVTLQFSANGSSSFATSGSLSVPPTISVSAAPEPGTWALMLGGVGILGGVLRAMQGRRREDEVEAVATA